MEMRQDVVAKQNESDIDSILEDSQEDLEKKKRLRRTEQVTKPPR